jgi:Ca2+/Na+ antiporter
MADRIKQYIVYINQLLDSDRQDIDWEEEMKKHLVQIGFFAHERLIHLIVTVTFAILTVMCFLYTISNFSVAMVLLIFAFMCLMIPYIKHYYLLENSVQEMYEQYDRMQQKAGTGFIRSKK